MRRFMLVPAFLLACSTGAPPPRNLPPAKPATTLGPGDLFEVSVLGEKDLPKEFRVQPDCSIDFPYIDRVTGVCGLEPQELVDKLKTTLKQRQILFSFCDRRKLQMDGR